MINLKMTSSADWHEYLKLEKKAWEYNDKAVDWHFRSKEFKQNSEEWQICQLKRKICVREFKKYANQAIKHYKIALKKYYPDTYKELWTN